MLHQTQILYCSSPNSARNDTPVNIHTTPIPISTIRVQGLKHPLVIQIKTLATRIHNPSGCHYTITPVTDSHTCATAQVEDSCCPAVLLDLCLVEVCFEPVGTFQVVYVVVAGVVLSNNLAIWVGSLIIDLHKCQQQVICLGLIHSEGLHEYRAVARLPAAVYEWWGS